MQVKMKNLRGNYINLMMAVFESQIHVPLRMSCNNFGAPVAFHPVKTSDQKLYSVYWFMT